VPNSGCKSGADAATAVRRRFEDVSGETDSRDTPEGDADGWVHGWSGGLGRRLLTVKISPMPMFSLPAPHRLSGFGSMPDRRL
jgi:hypothetical protein